MMSHNLDGKEGMNPDLDVFSAGDGTILGGFPVDNCSPAGNETTLHFFGGADEDSSDRGTDELGATKNINPIDQDDSSSRDEGMIAVFPARGINPINQDDSSGRDAGIIPVFPAGGINQDDSCGRDAGIIPVFPTGGINPINQDDYPARDEGIITIFPGGISPINMKDSSARYDEGIIAVFQGGTTDGINLVPADDFSAGNETATVIIPGGINNDEAEHDQNPISHPECPPSIGNDPSSDEDSSSGTYNKKPSPNDEEIAIKPVIVPETRKEPTKRAINKGSSGGTR